MKDDGTSNHLPPHSPTDSLSIFVTIAVLVWLAKQCSSQLPHNCKQKLQIRLCMPMPMILLLLLLFALLHMFPQCYDISLIAITTFFADKRIELELAELFAVPPSNLLSKFQPKTASSDENKNLQCDNAQWGIEKPGNNLENFFLIIRYFVY